jgi:hypothetical protein
MVALPSNTAAGIMAVLPVNNSPPQTKMKSSTKGKPTQPVMNLASPGLEAAIPGQLGPTTGEREKGGQATSRGARVESSKLALS